MLVQMVNNGTCDSALSRGNMLVQTKANASQLCSIPPELSELNVLELTLCTFHENGNVALG